MRPSLGGSLSSAAIEPPVSTIRDKGKSFGSAGNNSGRGSVVDKAADVAFKKPTQPKG
jgi:hypothetical protein